MSERREDAQRELRAHQLLEMPRQGIRVELIQGHVVREPPAGYGHSELALSIGVELREFVLGKGLGRVFGADAGFILARRPDTVRAPDVAFVANGRLPVPAAAGFAPLAPDLAVEVLSPTNTALDVEARVADYLEAGTRMVWIVNPGRRTVTVWTPPGHGRLLAPDAQLEGGEVLPGFRIEVATLFPA